MLHIDITIIKQCYVAKPHYVYETIILTNSQSIHYNIFVVYHTELCI